METVQQIINPDVAFYQSSKRVRAFRIAGIEGQRIQPEGKTIGAFDAPPEMFAIFTPEPGDYYVIDEFGNHFFAPREQFEMSFSIVLPEEAEAFSGTILDPHVQENIEAEFYVPGDFLGRAVGSPPYSALKLITVCILVMKNGKAYMGRSICADPRKYNPDVGQEQAKRDALSQVSRIITH